MVSIFLAMAAHVVLSGALYGLLTIARAPEVWSIGQRADGSNPFAEIEPRISANLSNQFEWPLFFHLACLLLLLLPDAVTAASIILAWTFMVGRVLHSVVHIFTSNVRLRGVVFTINFLAVFGLWWQVLVAIVG